MKLYSEGKNYKLYNGSMLDMLEVIEANTIDAVVTDPPYGLTSITKRFGKENSAECQYGKDGSFQRLSKGFMGKEWDGSGIEYNIDTWKKCYEVLKPGGYLLAFGGSRTFHRIACAIEDAGFEIRDTIMWLYGCYSADTQILTNEGWKYFYELNKNEKVMQWNKGTNKLSWIKPLNYFEYDIEDEMINLQNRHTNQLITKNHKVVCDIKKNHKKYNNYFDFVEAKDIKKTDAVKLPLASYYYGDINYEYAYIIGWWLTDAWKHQDGKVVCFSQSKPKTLEKLKKELDRLKALGKCNYSEYQRHDGNSNHNIEHSFYVTGEIADYLLKNFNDREFKKEFIELNKESKELLLEGLMDGDGTCRDNEYSKVFWSKKEQRNDILSALLTTMGYRNYISYNKGHCGVVFNIKHSTTEIQYKHKKENIMYKGKVYCLQTETGAFVVRRNGKPFISGNSGFPKSMNISKQLEKKGINELADKYKNYGTALKPSYESIIVARKPFKGSLVDNVIEYGVGGINIDECRVGNEVIKGGTMPDFRDIGQKSKEAIGIDKLSFGQVENAKRKPLEEHTGRFPANTILTYDDTDYEEVCGGFPNTKSTLGPAYYKGNYTKNGWKNTSKQNTSEVIYNDSGSASRYFYCAKASKKDRDEGLDEFEEKNTMCDRNPELASANMPQNRSGNLRKNTHPTVKPTELMQYLVRLVSPKGATILDPFNGSGSTGKAIMYENKDRNANYKYIGIDLSEEYLAISKARIEYVCNLKEEDEKQITIFDLK